jgi:hypothetical protein
MRIHNVYFWLRKGSRKTTFSRSKASLTHGKRVNTGKLWKPATTEKHDIADNSYH